MDKENKNLSNQNKPSPTVAHKFSFISKNKFMIMYVLLILATLLILSTKYTKLFTPQKRPQAVKKTVIKQVLVRRSKPRNVIIRATTAKAIDVLTGRVVKAARIFSVDDKTIYLSLDLNPPQIGTYIDYIRYLNGRYVDHGNVKISKPGTSNMFFSWTVTRPLGSITDGKWKVATYTNGILEKRIVYVVTKNKVSYVYPEERISLNDKDYKLRSSLSLLFQAD